MFVSKTIIRNVASIALIVGLALVSQPLRAQDSIRIAAVVNDHAISVLDVFERMAIVFVTANLEDTQEARQRLFPQVLRTLIDERLQLQEGARIGYEVSQGQLDAAAQLVEQSLGLQPGQLDSYLSFNRLSRDALMSELEAEIVWTRLVQDRMRDDNITEEEITEILQRIEASADEHSYLLAEIFLGVDEPEREGEVLANMQRLADAIRSGASFPAIARQFSQSASSANGGDLGWIFETQLTDELRAIVEQMTPGSMSQPTRVIGGYALILLRDERVGFGGNDPDPPFVLRQALLPVQAAPNEEELERQIGEIRAAIASCGDLDTLGGTFPSAQISPPITLRMSELQPVFTDTVAALPTGQPSDPLRTELGYHVLLVCERTEANGGLPTRDEILATLEDEQFDLVARGYLRDLRRQAFVDIRI